MLKLLCPAALSAVLPSLLIAPAIAARWVEVTPVSTPSGAKVYVDPDSVNTKGDVREFWGKTVHAKAQKNGSGKSYEQTVSRRVVNCAKHTWGVTQLIDYDREGSVVSSSELPLKMEPVVPGTVSEIEGNLVCQQRVLRVTR